jgi:hypothetical protein
MSRCVSRLFPSLLPRTRSTSLDRAAAHSGGCVPSGTAGSGTRLGSDGREGWSAPWGADRRDGVPVRSGSRAHRAARPRTGNNDVVSGRKEERGGRRVGRGSSDRQPAAPGHGGPRCWAAGRAALRRGAAARPLRSGGPDGNCAARWPPTMRDGPAPPGRVLAARRELDCHAAGASQRAAAGPPRHVPTLPAPTRASRAVPVARVAVSSYSHYNVERSARQRWPLRAAVACGKPCVTSRPGYATVQA